MRGFIHVLLAMVLTICAGCSKTERLSDHPSQGYGWRVNEDLSGKKLGHVVSVLGKPTEVRSYVDALKPSYSGTPFPSKFDKQLVYRKSTNMGHTLVYALNDNAVLVVIEHSDF